MYLLNLDKEGNKVMSGERFKIEFADVRLTPEQLKSVEDKITALEEKEVMSQRMAKFLKKISEVCQINNSDFQKVIASDVDYDIVFSGDSMSGRNRIFLRFKE